MGSGTVRVIESFRGRILVDVEVVTLVGVKKELDCHPFRSLVKSVVTISNYTLNYINLYLT